MSITEEAATPSATNGRGTKRVRSHDHDTTLLERQEESRHMVLLTKASNNNPHRSQALAKALLQVASVKPHNNNISSSSSSSRTDRKIIEALQRSLADRPTTTIPKKLVHVVEYPIITNHNSAGPWLTEGAGHVVLVLSARDITGLSTTHSTRNKSKLDWDHPLVQPGVSFLFHHQSSSPSDVGVFRHTRMTVVVLATQDEEDPSLLQSIQVQEKKGTKQMPTILLCRPNEPASCQTVARMLWRRLELGHFYSCSGGTTVVSSAATSKMITPLLFS